MDAPLTHPLSGATSMSETQSTPQSPTLAPAPTIRNAGTRPRTVHKLFVNVPVADVQRSITFFEALGFAFNPQFTDAAGTCMLVGEDAYCMLLTKERFEGFSKRPVSDPRESTNLILSFSVDSRDEVDAMVRRAVAAGGTCEGEPTDHGFMYEHDFHDLDGHGWGVFWMDPAAVGGDQQG
jgi:predicted lactoylglutathione lyase